MGIRGIFSDKGSPAGTAHSRSRGRVKSKELKSEESTSRGSRF
jgi:hypothetical protein